MGFSTDTNFDKLRWNFTKQKCTSRHFRGGLGILQDVLGSPIPPHHSSYPHPILTNTIGSKYVIPIHLPHKSIIPIHLPHKSTIDVGKYTIVPCILWKMGNFHHFSKDPLLTFMIHCEPLFWQDLNYCWCFRNKATVYNHVLDAIKPPFGCYKTTFWMVLKNIYVVNNGILTAQLNWLASTLYGNLTMVQRALRWNHLGMREFSHLYTLVQCIWYMYSFVNMRVYKYIRIYMCF